MIETICRAINLEPVYIEPGRCLSEFNTKSIQLEYKIPEIYSLLSYKEIHPELIKIRNKMYLDLSNISYKGKVFYTSSNTMKSTRDRYTYVWFDCLKIIEEKQVDKFKPYVYRNLVEDTITVYLQDTPSYHKYINKNISIILSNKTNEIIGIEVKLPEGNYNND